MIITVDLFGLSDCEITKSGSRYCLTLKDASGTKVELLDLNTGSLQMISEVLSSLETERVVA